MEQAAAAQQQQQQQEPPGLFRAQGFLPVDTLGRIDPALQCRRVSLCFCDTEKEQQVAEQLSAVWKGEHTASQQPNEFGSQIAARCAEEEEILQRLCSTVTLAQLRSLLADLRDSGELARLADSTAAVAAGSGRADGEASAPAQAGAQHVQVAQPSNTEVEEEGGVDGSPAQLHRRPGAYKLNASAYLPLDDQSGQLLSTAPVKQAWLLMCATREERVVAREVAYVWRELQLGSREADGACEGVMTRYRDEQELLQRLRAVSTLDQLRSLLRELRDSGELDRLAGSIAAGATGSGRTALSGPTAAAVRRAAAQAALCAQAPSAAEPSDAEGEEEEEAGDGSRALLHKRPEVCELQSTAMLSLDSDGRPFSTAPVKNAWLLKCATQEERVVAREVAHVWQEVLLGSSAGGGAGEGVMTRYQQEQQLLQRLRGVSTLDQLRSLLRELRDCGELMRLAGSTGAGAAEESSAAAQLAGQPQQPKQVQIWEKADGGGVPDASQPGKRWHLVMASSPAEAALARDLASAWQAAHGKGVQKAKMLQGQEAQGRLSQVLPDLLRRVLDASTTLQLRECLQAVKSNGELQRAAAQVNLSGAAEAVGAQRSTAQQAAAPRPASVAAPGAEGKRGGKAARLLPRKRTGALAVAQRSDEPSSKHAAVGGGIQALLGSPGAAAARAGEVGVEDGRQGAAAASAKAATGHQAALQQQGQGHLPQQGRHRHQVWLHARIGVDGRPDASMPGKQWFLLEVFTTAEAALARDLASAWRAAHGKGMREATLLQGQEVQERLSQALPALLHQVLDATTAPQLRECLTCLRDNGELQRAATRLNSGGTTQAMGARRSTAQQTAAGWREGEEEHQLSLEQPQRPEAAIGATAKAAGAEQQVAAVVTGAAGPRITPAAAAPGPAAAAAAGALAPVEPAAAGLAAAAPALAAAKTAGEAAELLPQQIPAADSMETEVQEQATGDAREGSTTSGLAKEASNAAAGTVPPSEGLAVGQTGRRKRGSITAVHGSERGPPSKRLAVAQHAQQTAAAQPNPGPVAESQQQQQQQHVSGHQPMQQRPGQQRQEGQQQESGSATTAATAALAATTSTPLELPTPPVAASGAAILTCQGEAAAHGAEAGLGHNPVHGREPVPAPPAAAPAAQQTPAGQEPHAPAAVPAAAPGPSATGGGQSGSMLQRLLAACDDERAQAAGLTHEVVSGYLAVLMGRCSEAQRQEAAEWVGPLLARRKFEAVRVFMERLERACGL